MQLTKIQKIQVIKGLQQDIGKNEVFGNDIIDSLSIALHGKPLTSYGGHYKGVAQRKRNIPDDQEKELHTIAMELVEKECIIIKQFTSKKGQLIKMFRLSEKILNYKEKM